MLPLSADIEFKPGNASGIIRALSTEHIGIPDTLTHKTDAYIFVTAGGAYTDIELVVTPSVDSHRMISILKSAVAKTPLATAPIYQSGYTSARILRTSGRIGVFRAKNKVLVGKLVAQIRAAGLNPYVLIRIPHTDSAINLNAPMRQRRMYTWYNASRIPKNYNLLVRAQMPLSGIALTLYIVLVVPVLGVFGFIAGLLAARNKRLPALRRRMLFLNLASDPVIIAFFAILPSGLIYLESCYGRILFDLWFGQADGPLSIFAIFAAIPLCSLILALILVALVKRLMFKQVDEEPDLPDLTSEGKRIRKHIIIWLLLLVSYWLYVLIIKPFRFPSVGGSISSVLFAVILTFNQIYFQHSVCCPKAGKDDIDEELTKRANAIANGMGVKFGDVRIVGKDWGKEPGAWVRLRDGVIMMSKKSMEVASPEEIDAILAHELAHLRYLRYMNRALVAPWSYVMIIISASLIYVLSRAEVVTESTFIVFASGILGLAPLMISHRMLTLQRRLEYAADRGALEATRDLDLVISALSTIVHNSSKPQAHDKDSDTHPGISNRIKALRYAAREMGLMEEASVDNV